MEKLNINKNRGITLIALVITIIVLLILAGVSIAMLTGENRNINASTGSEDKNGKIKFNRTSKNRYFRKTRRKTRREY